METRINARIDKDLKAEAEQVLAGMGVGAKNNDNEHVRNLNDIVKEVEKKTGGML